MQSGQQAVPIGTAFSVQRSQRTQSLHKEHNVLSLPIINGKRVLYPDFTDMLPRWGKT
jgi:hypothetical protein